MVLCLTMSDINWGVTKDVVSILGTVVTIGLGVWGLSNWSRQLRGTSEYNLAKKSIHLTYEVQHLFQGVRNPIVLLRKEEVETGNQLQEEQKIYDDRMQALHAKWAELQTLRLETKVIWQQPAYDCFHDLHKLIAEMRAAIWLHFWMKGAHVAPGATVDSNPERLKENEKIIYMMAEDDEFSLKIAAAVKKVENFFGNRVRSR